MWYGITRVLKMSRYEQYWEKSAKEVCLAALGGEPGSPHFEALKLMLETRNADTQNQLLQAQVELSAGLKTAAERQTKLTNTLKWATIIYVILTGIQACLLAFTVYFQVFRYRP
jgi:hypothetical protein